MLGFFPRILLLLLVPSTYASVEWMQKLLSKWANTGTCGAPAMCGTCGAIGGVLSLDGAGQLSAQVQACDHNASHLFSETATMFEIASNTKVFTSLLLQQVVDSNASFSMEDTLGQMLPPGTSYACPATANITLYEMGSHTAGLPSVPSNLPSTDPKNNPYTNYTQAQLWSYLASLPCCGSTRRPVNLNDNDGDPPNHDPQCLGPKGIYYYSNLGFGLLGYLLELRLGVDFEELLLRYQLRPLGLNSTKIILSQADWIQRVAPGHVDPTGEVTERRLPYGVLQGNGALHSTVDDMIRFLRAASGMAPSLSDAALQMAFRRIPAPVASDFDGAGGGTVDLGWFTSFQKLDVIHWKSGGTRGYGSFMCVDSQRKRVAFAVENCGNCGHKAIHRVAMGLLDGPPLSDEQRPWYPASERELNPFVGEYIFPRGVGVAPLDDPITPPISVVVTIVQINSTQKGTNPSFSVRLRFNASVFEEKERDVTVRPFYTESARYPAAAIAFAKPNSELEAWEAYFLLTSEEHSAQAAQLVLHVYGVDRFATRDPSSFERPVPAATVLYA